MLRTISTPCFWPGEKEFAEAVGPHLSAVRGVCRNILGSDDLAQDAVQETLLALWRSGQPVSELRGWLLRAAIHRGLHARRSRYRRERHECVLEPDACPCEASCGPEEHLANHELRELLNQALVALSEDQRAVVVMREIDGLEYDSIARVLDIPPGTVRSRLNRARTTLRRILGPAMLKELHQVERH